ncbi:hypothetical protein EXIGLDRAFT_700766 [Exidia glandulosa HHB12029]|uniref:Uncharacterized protein n=1 Tax=Exidia glandulosa HHB12029 TaxID=1314781 RepID=A0A165LYX8_EXIGL|nr:hypothetical protein EXIGLDRAFT_700766 [Exidia glandulosa HHB12029]
MSLIDCLMPVVMLDTIFCGGPIGMSTAQFRSAAVMFLGFAFFPTERTKTEHAGMEDAQLLPMGDLELTPSPTLIATGLADDTGDISMDGAGVQHDRAAHPIGAKTLMESILETNRVFCVESNDWGKLCDRVRFCINRWADHCVLVHEHEQYMSTCRNGFHAHLAWRIDMHETGEAPSCLSPLCVALSRYFAGPNYAWA